MSVNKLEADIVRLLPVNDLLYTRTSPMNPIASRTQKKSFSESSTGTFRSGSHAIVNLQSGTDFIDPLQSFVCFELEIEGVGAEARLLGGGAVNLIRESQVKARAGLELDRSEHHNLLHYHLLRTREKQYVDNNANGLYLTSSTTRVNNTGGLPLNYSDARPRDVKLATGTTYKVMIPLCDVFPIFKSDKLAPPHLCRGARLDCTLESLNKAFWNDGVAPVPTAYSITNWYVLHDSYRMSDDVLAFINENFASKESGLVYEFMSWHDTESSTLTSKMNVEVREAVTMATDAFAVTLDSKKAQILTADSLASLPVGVGDRSRWRIGSHYLPDTAVEGQVEHWAQYLYWAGKLRGKKEIAGEYKDFVGSTTVVAGNPTEIGIGMYPAVLNRNNILDQSGIAINNSSTLSVDATFGGVAPFPEREIHVYMRSVRRAVLFLESVQLEK
jgi:hypothetical protein